MAMHRAPSPAPVPPPFGTPAPPTSRVEPPTTGKVDTSVFGGDPACQENSATPSSRKPTPAAARVVNAAANANMATKSRTMAVQLCVKPDVPDPVVTIPSEGKVAVQGRGVFEVDAILDPHSDGYRALAERLVTDGLLGFNVCLFAYGQTGSGKTYTMRKVTEEVFVALFNTGTSASTWSMAVTVVEVYNEKTVDLLSKATPAPPAAPAVAAHRAHADPACGAGPTAMANGDDKVVWLPSRGTMLVPVRRIEVANVEEAMEVFVGADLKRQTASTKQNDTSSRSHAVLQIWLTETRSGLPGRTSKFSLVDLAGSERRETASAQTAKEGKDINQSLLALRMVIDALADNAMVPYRNSTLTHLLMDSLGGNCRTTMIATVNPSRANIDETVSTLEYASCARKITNVASVNEDPKARRIRQLEEEMELLRSQIPTDGGAAPSGDAEQELQRALQMQQHRWRGRWRGREEPHHSDAAAVGLARHAVDANADVFLARRRGRVRAPASPLHG